jgi:uncharacterized protein YtpQ (UPF0354 family)
MLAHREQKNPSETSLACPMTSSIAMCAVIGAAMLLAIALKPIHAADQFGPPQPGVIEESGVVRVCSEEGTPQELFAQIFIEVLRQRGVDSEVTLDPKEFRLIVRDGRAKGSFLYLYNAYADYCKAERGDRPDVLDTYVQAAIMSMADALTITQDSLLPVVRGRAFFEFVALMEAVDNPTRKRDWRGTSIGSDIVAVIASDSVENIAFLTRGEIADLGLSDSQALDIAMGNLRSMTDERWLEIGPGLYRSLWNDDYDSSRLLLVDMIGRLKLKGNPVALAPDRNLLLVTGAEDTDGLLRMAEIGKKTLDETTRPLSAQAITLVNGRWIDFVPQQPELQPLIDLHKEMLFRDYDQQKGLLDKLHEARGEDIFVASQILLQHEATGELTSHAVWSKGVVTLLPQADMIDFVRNGQDKPLTVPWAAAEKTVGALMTKTEFYPERYRVEAFPDDRQLEEMRTLAPDD